MSELLTEAEQAIRDIDARIDELQGQVAKWSQRALNAEAAAESQRQTAQKLSEERDGYAMKTNELTRKNEELERELALATIELEKRNG